MGGKRPDRYRIDAGKADATDHELRDRGERPCNADEQRFAEGDHG